MPQIAIVEDHGLIAQTVATALTARGNDVRVIEPTSLADVAEDILAEPPDLVLLDLDLGTAGDATPAIERISAAGAPVVVVTGVEDPVRRARCVAAGAVGIVTKSVSFDALLEAIGRVLDDGTLLTPAEREEHLRLLRDHTREKRDRMAPFEALTTREAEVLGELLRGRSVRQIAKQSFVSVATVRSQIRAVLAKLDVPSQVAAVGRAREAGWVPPQEHSCA